MDAADPWTRAEGWRPVVADNLHTTAWFIGERQAGALQLLHQLGEAVARDTAPFTLAHGRLITMPSKRPSMMWLLFAPCPAFEALHRRLAETMGMAAALRDPVLPHITLCRARGRPAAISDGPVLLPALPITELTLFRSEATAAGRRYLPLATWPLTGTAPVDPLSPVVP